MRKTSSLLCCAFPIAFVATWGTIVLSAAAQVTTCSCDADCSGATPFCYVGAGKSTGSCVQCLDSSGCSATTPVCDLLSHACTPCTADGPPSCPDPDRPACQTYGPLAGACTECSSSNSGKCTGGKPVCLSETGV